MFVWSATTVATGSGAEGCEEGSGPPPWGGSKHGNAESSYRAWHHTMLGDKLMRNQLRFFVDLVQQPVWIPIWVLFLMIIHVASVGFWHEPVAQLIFASFLMSAMLMMGLYSRFGFEKILGLGHIPWIPVRVPVDADSYR